MDQYPHQANRDFWYGKQIEDKPWVEKMPAHLLIVGRKEGSN